MKPSEKTINIMLVRPYKIKNRKHNGPSVQWGVRAYHAGVVSTRELAKRISANCSLKVSDVEGCLTALGEEMRNILADGYRVDLRDIGSFRLGVKSETMDDICDFNCKTDILGFRVNFQPETTYTKHGPKKAVRPLTDGVRVERCPKKIWDDELERQRTL